MLISHDRKKEYSFGFEWMYWAEEELCILGAVQTYPSIADVLVLLSSV